jgi:predicted TIM-barrel fold metal-dependent hydrolase
MNASFAESSARPARLPALIDVHLHSVPKFWFDEARPAVAAQVGGPIGSQWTSWSVQQTLDHMDASGIAFAVQSITAPGVWFGDDQRARQLARRCNEFMANAAAAHPHRLGVHAALPLPDVEGSLSELGYALDTLKADGVGLMTSYGNRWLGDPAFEPLMRALDERSAVVFVHPLAPQCCSNLMPAVSPNFIEFLQDTNRAILNLMFTGTLHRYPRIRFIFCHAGGSLPMMAGRVTGLLARYPQQAAQVPQGVMAALRALHYDVTNSTNQAALSALLAIVPDSQLLFGTDYPIVPTEATLHGLRAGLLTPDQLVKVAHGNARRLYPRAERALA